ncbi:MAG: hypothetical protein P8Z79_14900 [Sedimentisphaerales bacterium]|jgi:DNA-directed RNA polymerase specialized sigma24 family protein
MMQFPPTEWTRVVEPSLREAIQNELPARYWKPIYCYLRRKGYSNEEAKDITQDFFTEIILDRGLFKNVERSKGKFRTLLLTALEHYVISFARFQKRKKRYPGPTVMLDEQTIVPDQSLTNPEDAFDYGWASQLLENVLNSLKIECDRDDLSTHWEVFNAKVLKPIIENTKPPSLEEICKKFNVTNNNKASNMIVTVKRRFRRLLEHHVRTFVESEAEVAREISRLIDVFSRNRAVGP